MKFFSLLLLVSASLYAAESALTLSDEIVAMGDNVIRFAWSRAMKQTGGSLTGTLSDMYRDLWREGYKGLMQKHPEAVVRASEIFASLTDENSDNEDVKNALVAFKAAQAISNDPVEGVALEAWKGELNAYSVALIKLIKPRTPENLVIHPLTTERIVLNNGKFFADDALADIRAGTLAVLAGFERRRDAMGHELFGRFCDGLLLNSPAHATISAIDIPEAK
jgi:hypothetical protein